MLKCESECKITRQINGTGSIVTQIENPAAYPPLIRILPEIVRTKNTEIILKGDGFEITVPEETLTKITQNLSPGDRIRAFNLLLQLSKMSETLGVKEKSSTCLY